MNPAPQVVVYTVAATADHDAVCRQRRRIPATALTGALPEHRGLQVRLCPARGCPVPLHADAPTTLPAAPDAAAYLSAWPRATITETRHTLTEDPMPDAPATLQPWRADR